MEDYSSTPPDGAAPSPESEWSRRRCSFCGLENREHIIGGDPPPLAVCLDCVVLFVEIFKEDGTWPET